MDTRRAILFFHVLLFTQLVSSYFIADTCDGNELKARISQAINEAKGVARYAAWRIDVAPPFVNEGMNAHIVEELLGNVNVAIPRFKGESLAYKCECSVHHDQWRAMLISP